MKKIIFTYLLFIIALSTALVSCMRLDDNLYNLSEKITEYKRDNYTGVQDFILDASYKIHDSLIHPFALHSQTPGETEIYSVEAVYIGSIKKILTDTVIMYCHGNKWHNDFYWQRAKLLANTGGKSRYGVLMIDYRGYGLSTGKPTETGLFADIDAGLVWLKSKGLDGSRLIMYGFSMGSAPATELTAFTRSLRPHKLILEAPFASSFVMVQDASGLNVPTSYVTNLKINNAEKIKSVNQPFLWIHGTEDDFLNISTHGEVIYKNYQGPYSEPHRIEGANHGTIQSTLGFNNYNNIINTFIQK
jgi:pimeloyl-ACP methyl ester carboxylesterase